MMVEDRLFSTEMLYGTSKRLNLLQLLFPKGKGLITQKVKTRVNSI